MHGKMHVLIWNLRETHSHAAEIFDPVWISNNKAWFFFLNKKSNKDIDFGMDFIFLYQRNSPRFNAQMHRSLKKPYAFSHSRCFKCKSSYSDAPYYRFGGTHFDGLMCDSRCIEAKNHEVVLLLSWYELVRTKIIASLKFLRWNTHSEDLGFLTSFR